MLQTQYRNLSVNKKKNLYARLTQGDMGQIVNKEVKDLHDDREVCIFVRQKTTEKHEWCNNYVLRKMILLRKSLKVQ